MARLTLSLLGPPEIRLDGRPVHFAYRNVQALLVYLAVEADRAHPRAALAGLLWSERPGSVALSHLRRALSTLRSALDDHGSADGGNRGVPFILTTRQTIEFNDASDYWLDMKTFQKQTEAVYLVLLPYFLRWLGFWARDKQPSYGLTTVMATPGLKSLGASPT